MFFPPKHLSYQMQHISTLAFNRYAKLLTTPYISHFVTDTNLRKYISAVWQVAWQIYECINCPSTAGGIPKKRTALVDKRGTPGLATANLLAQIRGHKGEDPNCRCSVGFILKGGKLVKAKVSYKKGGKNRGARHLCWKAKPITAHTFNAGHFATMAKDNKTHLPLTDALEILDFAMGYNCIQNGEVQSIHWSPETVTILSIGTRPCMQTGWSAPLSTLS